MDEIEGRETLEQSRMRYATSDADVRVERMLTEIEMGGTKETSLVVRGPVDSALWDRLAQDIAEIRAKGGEVIYGFRWHEDG